MKPFHVGHLRSTITGQMVCNFIDAKGDDVVRINYLGDWGEQFSKLIVGYEEFGSDYPNIWEENSISKLVSIYVRISELEREPEFIEKINDAADRLHRRRFFWAVKPSVRILWLAVTIF